MYAAVGPSPEHDAPGGPFGSPDPNTNNFGVAVAVAHTGPACAVTDNGPHVPLIARKSTGAFTYTHGNSLSCKNTYGSGFGIRRFNSCSAFGNNNDGFNCGNATNEAPDPGHTRKY